MQTFIVEKFSYQGDLDEKLLDVIGQLYDHEKRIDPNETLYLITWSPDPASMPDADFNVQHQCNIDVLTTFLKGCSLGIFCVESTQKGNPHYHGWYQETYDPVKNKIRLAAVKTMIAFSDPKYGLKISDARSYKFNRWTKHSNCLYYYKKDSVDKMLLTELNPITVDTEPTLEFQNLDLIGMFSRAHQKKSFNQAKERMSDLKFYKQFYYDSVSYVNQEEYGL